MAGAGAEAASLKQMIQHIVGGDVQILMGTVSAVNPLKIQMEGDEKLAIGGSNITVPWHLTDYTTEATYEYSGGGSSVDITLTVHNALKVGEAVCVLSVNHGKRYYVLDRAG